MLFRKARQMQKKRASDDYGERARLAAEAAAACDIMGHSEIALAYRNIEKMWLRLAEQNDSLERSN